MNDLIHWIRTKRSPEDYSDRLYHVEPGCEYGYKEDDGFVWNRIQ